MIQKPIDRAGVDNNVWIWKYPLSEHDYVISADVSRGDAKDYSTFHVIDTTESEVVAEYKGKIRPDTFGELINEFGLKYNKALVCPENNSYGFATVLKLQDLKYPKLYYRKRKALYIGDYVPPASTETAGFNTNGKTRGTILAKLEEVIRNKTLIIRSSRFYEELKVFTWKGGRVAAKRGFNDDLVMSLAIGTWLYDASGDYSKNSKALNDAILSCFSRKERTYNDTPDAVFNPIGVYGNISKTNRENTGKDQIIKSNVKKALNRGMIPDDMKWVLD
jgi:hypothetical protein